MIHINKSMRASALGAMLLLGVTGCNVLVQDPPTALTPSDAFANADRISKSAIGMYDFLQNAEFLGGRALIYSDVRSDDTNSSPYFSTIVNTAATLPNDAYATNGWTGGYRSLYGVNYFLQQIALNTGKTTPELEAQYIGEAEYIRALVYFNLVNLYAQPYNFTSDASHLGVPIQLVAPDAVSAFDPSQNLSRSTVKQVYDQIEKDLLDALTKLPETYTTDFDKTGRVTKDAARTLLSRMYLYKADYVNAAKYSGDVITGNRHALNDSPVTPFSATSYQTSESIFSVAMNSSDNPNTNNALGQHYGGKNRADITVTPYARIDTTQFRSKDRRRTLLITPAAYPTAAALVYTLKYNNASFDYVPIHRYSEVLLNRAEALAQTSAGVSAEAITLLNTVRRRSLPNIPAYPSVAAADFAISGKQGLIDAILFERRLELAFEGHRYYDLLRYKRNPGRINYGDDRVVLPIPLVDIQQNPNLVQNKGY
ncbi:RagB/SusD family nutrient uptake outer membrane protein [Hymenobacter sp. H14-R3]|uniref:RagB/SusD family nutrient uptake outer membrane protein n=1 Tax=Hymenobacter sp. H14-R3 TaxID=3046308 RepID=UPI0024B87A78|nr:RagB/SusD family nutrient uptake outer membrane protein [Hymenobacter sp. H14-R3]MDJ0364782.1 RagB/SusD family nutrient uptake outer membrane protein [Hymenobacter sp. H14-R3]